ncbi:hypothetical protein D8666_09485 [Ochrobactrum soli]|uniref:hypothetical protein n=1 Tax=Brucella/Ochrobactrum group TaxID=2826938 RepID=UPI000EF2044D|nr:MULTISPECIES: hypothetical protein [Brucella]MDX4075494.1 hypothetical protein [Brucella sp. NBRC 113783]RLL75478.1 hypothetical protein D8666_09485 [[Ochrobactrum] soli]WHS32542.1 hypothetical protein QLQ09_11605 [Brucella sp. NM4]WHT42971.1 hypothetical protein QLQ11_05805 [Ochrobactrum sp. SSR]
MQKASQNRSSLFPVFATVLLAALAGCTTSGSEKPGDMAAEGPKRISASELRAYCPTVTLRDGTAFFSTYAKGGDKDPAQVVYQASLTDVTRSCQYGDGNITIDVAAAGKVVPGPKYKSGTITMPVRVAVRQGDQVVYSKLHKQAVTITNGDTATQFVFNDKGISLPMPDKQNIQIFVGFDEGPNPK